MYVVCYRVRQLSNNETITDDEWDDVGETCLFVITENDDSLILVY